MAKKPTIIEGQTFTDSTGAIVTVVKYETATKVHVQWGDGVVQAKSAQQLRTGNFSQRTRKTKGGDEATVQQPYKQAEERSVTPSLFDNMEPDESYKDSDED